MIKRVLPDSGKNVVRNGLRGWGRATAGLRPLPDFLVIGTKRGGTTSLWNYLLSHPGVLPMFPSPLNIKSPHYFYWHYANGPLWYRSHFASTPTRTVLSRLRGAPTRTGEASPNYLYDPRVPARAAELLPTAKVIMLLRDPAERAYSHYKERVRAGVEDLSFEDALAAEPGRLAGEAEKMQADPYYYSRPYDYYAYQDRGVYAPQIERWQQQVPAERLLILRSEDFYDEPATVFNQVTRFLELPDRPLQNARRYNYHAASGMEPATRSALHEFFAEPVADVEKLLGREMGWLQ
ncbi:sulfotransferase [Kineosporia babensis]|uniref:Sulfotransferase domain-containing protein n=1 Tax=Kineosporia babensis TaxID=499548 RepID=A0A9X1NHY6_9ACTN|nr:sulfotransferase [Kineosporia babensis]MCD5315352.1 sulfotransferase domain-containing protein [Kineosporia babensis]